MKRFIVIGLGNFGASVATSLYQLGHDVVAIDMAENAVDRIAPHVTRAAVGNGTQIQALEQLGAKEADSGIISTGDDITSSILATMALYDLGVKEVYVKVISHEHDRVMKRLGVEETIFPEHESGHNLSMRLTGQGLLNYMNLAEGYSIQEMVVPESWRGKTLRELDIRRRFQLSVLAIHDMLLDRMILPPDPDSVLKDSDTIMVAGKNEELIKISRTK